ncbi:receptor-type tyrosine-protein phosphatase N2-like [Tachypleus tridentatus]|uniref:receptor-type tyrosine-protein phosphatase N2-like n=1 Tax=Tachypleus tridentatus TaxID=6853 RepID=UPI003FD5F735
MLERQVISVASSAVWFVKKEEFCYDDNIFGRCQTGNNEGGGLYRSVLTPATFRLLENNMKRRFSDGYRWSDDYTQCVLQNILYTEKRRLIHDPGLCSRVLKKQLSTVFPLARGSFIPDLERKLIYTEGGTE